MELQGIGIHQGIGFKVCSQRKENLLQYTITTGTPLFLLPLTYLSDMVRHRSMYDMPPSITSWCCLKSNYCVGVSTDFGMLTMNPEAVKSQRNIERYLGALRMHI